MRTDKNYNTIRLTLIICLLISINSFAQQQVEIDTVKNSEIVKLFNQIELLKSFKIRNLAIKIYQFANESGSAGYENCEITHDIYFAVSEFDEQPNQALFVIRNLYSVEIEITDKSNENCALILISHFEKTTRKELNLELTINELKISK